MTALILCFSPRSWQRAIGLAGLWATLQGAAAPALAASSPVEQRTSTSHGAVVAQSVDQAYALYQRSRELLQAGRYVEAISLAEEALAIVEVKLGPEHANTGASLNNLALLYESVGRYSEAEPLYQRAITIAESQRGPRHPSTAVGQNNLAVLYVFMSRHSEAEPLYQRALAIREVHLGPEHPDTASSIVGLAGLYE